MRVRAANIDARPPPTNRLEALLRPSKYVDCPHQILAVDDTPLDALLAAARPDLNLLGLVPTLLDWLSAPEERELVRQRILPSIGSSAIAPILMCPDDLDLSCTVVVVEVAREARVVWWRRIGLDRTKAKPGDMPLAIGNAVDWIDGLGPYCFESAAYQNCLAAFGRPET